MPKRQMNGDPQPLTLQTLSGNYEAARDVLNVFPISTISTFTQLSKRLQAIAKDTEQVILLYDALERLDASSMDLGLTALVRALDHPLVPRSSHVPKDKQ